MEAVRNCQKHGDLYEKDVIKEKNKNGVRLRCKKCKLEASIKRGGICRKHGELKREDIRSDGRCAICHRATTNAKRNANRPEFNARIAISRLENPEKWIKEYKRQYLKSVENHGKEKRNTLEIIRRRGLKIDDYENMFEAQNHKCAICQQKETRAGRTKGTVTRLCVDHCHKTNTVRGLLCHACNTAIGKFKDNADLLEKAIRYLRK